MAFVVRFEDPTETPLAQEVRELNFGPSGDVVLEFVPSGLTVDESVLSNCQTDQPWDLAKHRTFVRALLESIPLDLRPVLLPLRRRSESGQLPLQ